MSVFARLRSTETAISGAQHKYKHISSNKIVASALTPSNGIHITLDAVQLVAMVLLPVRRRGLGEHALLGKRRFV